MQRERLNRLRERWRVRRDARRPSPDARRPADPEREALASRAFPFRTMTPSEYVARHGTDMQAFTYDEDRYSDPDLDAWLAEVGTLLRRNR